MPLLICKNAAFGYEGKTVVENLDFEVEEGEFLSIVGENGGGKSTLVKGLLRLKKPIMGSIEYNGIKRNEIGYLPQQKDIEKDFPASVTEVVISGRLGNLGFRPFYSKKDKLIAEENIGLMGITDLKRSCFRELSGGQQQRVLLARALCASGKLLLLDEPVSGLDPLMTADFYNTLKMLNKDKKVTVIMVSHDINTAAAMSDRILHIGHSQLFFGTAEEYRKSPVGKYYLGGSAYVKDVC